ncbi:MAG TPA: hypothetical protein VEP91_01095 [Solirubrobacterales bacterium]|nr:hypothetical protein [Solirubrobacterales bacterium]
MDYSEFNEQRIKHLEMIQAVITRLSNEGFVVKGWAVTVAGVFAGLAINSEEWKLAAIACFPTVAFWILDTSFLRAERLFRALHEHVRRRTEHVEPFFMAATAPAFLALAKTDPGDGVDSWWRAFARPAIRNLYIAIVAALIVVSVVAANMDNDTAPESGKPGTLVHQTRRAVRTPVESGQAVPPVPRRRVPHRLAKSGRDDRPSCVGRDEGEGGKSSAPRRCRQN